MKLTTDGGPQFSSRDFANFCNRWGIDHDPSSPYHHQSNGHAEAAVKACKWLVAKTTKRGNLNTDEFKEALLEFRNTPREDGVSPAQRLFGRPMRTRLPVHRSVFSEEHRVVTRDIDDRATTLKEKARLRYNQSARPLGVLKPGDIVRMQNMTTRRWDVIGEVLGFKKRTRSYIVKTESGALYWRNRKFLRPAALSRDLQK